MLLTFEEALQTIQEKLTGARSAPSVELVPLESARGRVLAEDVAADRDYPPFHRAARDGFAVRSGDLLFFPCWLAVVGEVRAGDHFDREIGPGEAASIMTGAPLPAGADAVVMIEHCREEGGRVEVGRGVRPSENVVRKGSETAEGASVLRRGSRAGPAEIGLLAAVGRACVGVYAQPRVAILPTGDELVPVDARPEWFQIRNSNAASLAAQVAAAGGVPQVIGPARDSRQELDRHLEAGLQADLLLLSGGVSTGKYDLVLDALRDRGAEVYFHGVAIRPGKPLLFGRAAGKFFFGLPGNPVSTLVTFELFARPAIGVLGGAAFEPPVFLLARLAEALPERPTGTGGGQTSLTSFLPAKLEVRGGQSTVRLAGWQGSGDLVGVAASNCFMVIRPGKAGPGEGDWVEVLPKE